MMTYLQFVITWTAVGIVVGATICNLLVWFAVIQTNRKLRQRVLQREPEQLFAVPPEFRAQETPPPTVMHSNDSFER